MAVTPKYIETRFTYAVEGEEPLRDARRSVFNPTEVTVYKRNGRVWLVKIEGKKIKNGHVTATCFSVYDTDDDVTLEVDHRNGPAPAWVFDVVFSVAVSVVNPEPRFPTEHTVQV